MYSFQIEMFPSGAVLAADFVAIAGDISSYRQPLEDSVVKVAIPAIGTNFDEGGRPQWQDLSDATLERRAYDGTGDQPLNATGTLRQAALAKARWTINSDEAFVSNLPSSAWYGIVQQDGIVTSTTTIPARPFFDMTEDDVDDVEEIFYDWIERVFITHGF